VLPKLINSIFKRNELLIQAQAKGISHIESLLQPPFRANCFNWVLGHILSSRALVLQKLGSPPPWQAQTKRYERGSAPLTVESTDVIDFITLLKWLGESQKQLSTALKALSDEQLSTPQSAEAGSTTLGEWLMFLAWHESYHSGQTEQLRQLAGKDDSVIA
jgi:uncharacterized damage-inducible protein DinB